MSPHRYVLDFFTNDNAPLGQVPASVDWTPAKESAWLRGLRNGELPHDTALGSAQVTIEPVWSQTAGEPYLSGFDVRILANGHGQSSSRFTTSYFAGMAEQASSQFIERGLLKNGDLFRYLVAAYPDVLQQDTDAPLMKTAAAEPALPFRESSLDGFLQRSVAFMPLEAPDIPVFVHQEVLLEAAAAARAAGTMETGGVLIGHLHRDALPEVFLEITAQIPAHHAHSGLTKLTFVPETWSAVHAALKLRGQQELFLGWWHAHNYLKGTESCKDPACRRKGRQACASFFSPEDRHLHRAVFGRAYHVALVVADAPCSGLTWTCFGWRDGVVTQRGFHLLGFGS